MIRFHALGTAFSLPLLTYFTGNRVLNRALFLEMRQLGVEVPFPQVDVHQK